MHVTALDPRWIHAGSIKGSMHVTAMDPGWIHRWIHAWIHDGSMHKCIDGFMQVTAVFPRWIHRWIHACYRHGSTHVINTITIYSFIDLRRRNSPLVRLRDRDAMLAPCIHDESIDWSMHVTAIYLDGFMHFTAMDPGWIHALIHDGSMLETAMYLRWIHWWIHAWIHRWIHAWYRHVSTIYHRWIHACYRHGSPPWIANFICYVYEMSLITYSFSDTIQCSLFRWQMISSRCHLPLLNYIAIYLL